MVGSPCLAIHQCLAREQDGIKARFNHSHRRGQLFSSPLYLKIAFACFAPGLLRIIMGLVFCQGYEISQQDTP